MSYLNARPTRRPDPITGSWLPSHPADRLQWLDNFLKEKKAHRKSNNGPTPCIENLKNLVENSAVLSMLFRSIFDEIPYNYYRHDPTGKEYTSSNFEDLLTAFEDLLRDPPKYDENVMVALPFSLLLEWPMSTKSGIAAFLDKELNEKLGDVLTEWGNFLTTKDSAYFVIDDPNQADSWLSQAALDIMVKRDPRDIDPTKWKFQDTYVCPDVHDPDKHLGFKSWDQFFTREFIHDDAHPTDPTKNARVVEDMSDATITSAFESAPYAIKQKVKATEKFWIKGQPYSLKHMLLDDDDAKRYKGGTVYQAFLSPLTYHRWHSPINGTISKIRLIKGSYFSVSPVNSFPDPEVFVNTQSQPYLASVATRAIFYIKCNSDVVGEMVVMPIGMVEVSTCAINQKILGDMVESYDEDEKHNKTGNITYTPKDLNAPHKVSKGTELGMFHFGGSTSCLIFGPHVELKFHQRAIPLDTDDNYFVGLNQVIADVKKATPRINKHD